jgi:hypothetical protein
LPARLPLRVHRRPKEGHVADAGDFHGILEGQEQTRRRAFLGFHLQKRVAVKCCSSVRHLIAVAARQDIRQGRLARPVRPHDRMHLARADLQVYAPQDDLVFFLKLDVQIIDFQHFSSLGPGPAASLDSLNIDRRARGGHHQHVVDHLIV